MDVCRWAGPTLLLAFALLAFAATGCAVDQAATPDGGASPTGSPPAATTPPPAPQPSAAPSGPTGTPTAASGVAADSLPAGWRLCTNQVRRYRIGYPGGWHTDFLVPEQRCRVFDPEPFEIPPGSEFPMTALTAVPTLERFDRVLRSVLDPAFNRTVHQKNVRVNGRRAVRIEQVATGDGPEERGTRRYGYVLDVRGRAFIVDTTATPDDQAYAQQKSVVDTAVRTLRFF